MQKDTYWIIWIEPHVNTHRPFVNVEVMTNTVTSTMHIIQADIPKSFTS